MIKQLLFVFSFSLALFAEASLEINNFLVQSPLNYDVPANYKTQQNVRDWVKSSSNASFPKEKEISESGAKALDNFKCIMSHTATDNRQEKIKNTRYRFRSW